MRKDFNWKSVDIMKVAMYYGLCDGEKDNWCFCPVHELDGQAHKPSCKLYKNTDKDVLICYGGCTNKKGTRLCLDSLSLVGAVEKLDSTDNYDCVEILNKLEMIDSLEEFNIGDGLKDKKRLPTLHEKCTFKTETSKTDDNYFEYMLETSKDAHQLREEKKYYLDNYFNKRGIIYDKCEEALKLNHIEIKHKYSKGENYIIMFDLVRQFGIKRKIDDYLNGKTYSKGEIKYSNINNVNYSLIKGDKKNIVIFESFYDLLALYSHLKNPSDFAFISINSVSNYKKVADSCHSLFEKADNIFFLTDNDDAGTKVIDNFRNYFKEERQTELNNIKDIRYKLDGCKDVCDYIKSHPYIRIESESIKDDERKAI